MLGIAVLGISFAAPLVRLSESAALVIAAWRLGLSLVIIALALLVSGQWREWKVLRKADVAFSVGGGVLLAFHFWSWNASLTFTTVAASVTLVNLQPVIVALISARWLGERATTAQWVGIGVAVLGALVVGLADVPEGLIGLASVFTGGIDAGGHRGRALFGDFLAIIGAMTASVYYLIGRRVRQKISLWPYVGLVYGAAFITCVVLAMATNEVLWPQQPREIALFTGLALGPMLIGHTGMNWALGHLPAYVVNLTTLGEPIGATILAALLPGIGEVPGNGTIVGGLLILGGILLTVRRR